MRASNLIELPDWVLSLCVLKETNSLFASTSKGSLHQIPLDPTKWNASLSVNTNLSAHSGPIHKIITDPESPNTLFTCSDDSTVKVWDIRTSPISRPQHTLSNSRQLPFFSLDVRHGLISAGSQLKGTDSELVLWDTRKLDSSLRSFIDSHNDDITDTKFHPTRKNVLLSGATDGYVNVYDLNIVDEDDAQLQCINYASVHSTGFTSQDRIYVLSHMETFSLFDLSSKKDIDPESVPEPVSKKVKGDIDLGDIREKWGCEYVVDLFGPGYVACGSNSSNSMKIFEIDVNNEVFDPSMGNSWTLDGAHGEEIVRDVAIFQGSIFTGGEDNIVRVWNGDGLNDTQECFFYDDENINNSIGQVEEERMEVEYDLDKSKSKDRVKEKKHKKHKKDPKNKKHRFKPY